MPSNKSKAEKGIQKVIIAGYTGEAKMNGPVNERVSMHVSHEEETIDGKKQMVYKVSFYGKGGVCENATFTDRAKLLDFITGKLGGKGDSGDGKKAEKEEPETEETEDAEDYEEGDE